MNSPFPPPLPSLEVGVPNVKGSGDPVAGEFPPLPLPKVKEGAAGGAPAPNEKDVVGAPAPALDWALAPNWNVPLGGALPNVKEVVCVGAVGAPNEKDVVDAGG